MRCLQLIGAIFYLFISNNVNAEINSAQKKIIKSQIILIHEGMVSKDTVFKKAKLFDKEGVFGIGSTEMSEEEFDKFFDQQSLHLGY